jgi:hypothetical protein
VDDFLVDENWNIRYLVVDTSNWPGGAAVLIPASAVDRVDSPKKRVFLKLTSQEVRDSPPADSADVAVIETLGPTIM